LEKEKGMISGLRSEIQKSISQAKSSTVSAPPAKSSTVAAAAQPAASTNDRIVQNLRDENEVLRQLVDQLRGDLDLATQLNAATEKPPPKTRGQNYFIIEDAEMSAEVQSVEDCLRAIMQSEEVEFSSVVELNQFFKVDSGRRKFTQMLETYMLEFSSLTLSTDSFELLLYLINTTLTEMDTSDASDLITAKILMRASSIVKRETDAGDQYIQEYITSYSVYHDVQFWEELFWDELFASHKQRSGMADDDIYQLDHKLTLQVVKNMVVVMTHWKNYREEIQRFINHIFKQTKTPDEVIQPFRELTAQDSFWNRAASSKIKHGTWNAKKLKREKKIGNSRKKKGSRIGLGRAASESKVDDKAATPTTASLVSPRRAESPAPASSATPAGMTSPRMKERIAKWEN